VKTEEEEKEEKEKEVQQKRREYSCQATPLLRKGRDKIKAMSETCNMEQVWKTQFTNTANSNRGVYSLYLFHRPLIFLDLS
jgi:hypothetical protein